MREGAGGHKFGVCEASKVGSYFWGCKAHMGKDAVSWTAELWRKCQITGVWSWGRMHSYERKWLHALVCTSDRETPDLHAQLCVRMCVCVYELSLQLHTWACKWLIWGHGLIKGTLITLRLQSSTTHCTWLCFMGTRTDTRTHCMYTCTRARKQRNNGKAITLGGSCNGS